MSGTGRTAPRWLPVALGVAWAALAALMASRVWGFALDDFFITYRYAWNLLDGQGFVFNPGERVFGTTAPGMGLLVAAVSLVTRLTIPEAGTVVTAVALWWVAWTLYREELSGARGGEAAPRRIAETVVAGTLLLASTFLWVHVGAEGPVSLALLLGAAGCVTRRPILAGLLVGAAVWCRPDAGLGAAILGLLVWRERRRLPWHYGISGVAAIAAGLVSAQLWFGRMLPETLHAKRLQAAWMPDIWAGGLAFWGEALKNLSTLFFGRAVMTFVVVGLIGLGLVLRRGGRVLRLLALYALTLAVAYPILGVAFYGWYIIPTVAALYYGVAWTCGAVARWGTGFFGGGGRARWVAACLALLIAWPALGVSTTRAVQLIAESGSRPRYELYRHVGLWLRGHVPADEAIAYVEVGTVAYFGRRPVRDLLGLVSPESLPWVARGDMAGAFLARPTPWLIYDTQLHGFIEPIRATPWFAPAYREVARFRHRGSGEELIVYRRRPGSELPPPEAIAPPGETAPAAAAADTSANGTSAAATR